MNMNDQVTLLRVPLPEDIMKYKWYGDFDAAMRLIDRRIAGDIPDVMQRRLLLEKQILQRLPADYPYTRQEMLDLLSGEFEDFRPEELDELMERNEADWIFIGGRQYFHNLLLENLIKTRADYAMRSKGAGRREGTAARTPKDFLLDAIQTLRREGRMSCTIRLRARLWLTDLGKPVSAREVGPIEHVSASEVVSIEHVSASEAVPGERPSVCRPVPGETVSVYLPLPGVDAQVKAVRVLDDGASRLPDGCLHFVKIAPEHAAQRTICWKANWQPGMEFTVEYEYDLEADYVDLWSGQDECAASGDAGNASGREDGNSAGNSAESVCGFARESIREGSGSPDQVTEDDLSEQEPHIVFSPLIRELTREVVGDEERPLEKARRIYDYITTKVHYSFMRSYVCLPSIADYAAAGQKGDCGVQALLFITMCRMAGVPARWQSGLYANPADVGCHDWARFYTEEYGWRYADCSFGGSAYRDGDEERRRFYFGNLDPFRMPSCRRFQTEFDPPMKKLRSDPYDAQSGEVEQEGDAAHGTYAFESETVMVEFKMR